ncbi:MAG: nucleotidyl transferase AbiEii/AbiGii toxin family protein [Desulfobacteraceae bacterium]|nr:nucleotidyl transferase AbiEii/AbiGii toxin family protein [Desulfobacteraceae bacterium]
MKRTNAPFYLTGGTALSRHYSPVRYSDDLDFFVNRDSEFSSWAERLYAELETESRRGSFAILSDRVIRFEDYVQLFVQQSRHNQRVTLKIDLVNDVAPHYGTIEWDEALGRVDSWRNILSNKVSALYRVEAKDVIDLWTLARIKTFNWTEIIREASSKEAGLDPVVLYDLLKSFPKEELSNIKWIDPRPDEEIILGDLSVMADEIFEGHENSLG